MADADKLPNPTYYDRARDATVVISDATMAEGRRLYRAGYRQVSRKFRHVARGTSDFDRRVHSKDVLTLDLETFEAFRAEARAAEIDSLPTHDWPNSCQGPRLRESANARTGKAIGVGCA